MKTTVFALSGLRVVVESSPSCVGRVRLVICDRGAFVNAAQFDEHSAAVLGKALLDLAKKIEDEKTAKSLTAGIDWDAVERQCGGFEIGRY